MATGRGEEAKTLKKINVNHDLLALFVAAMVLLLTVWEGYETRRHHRISVVPKLDLDVNLETDETTRKVHFGVESSGLGPVKVMEFEVLYNGVVQPVEDPFARLIHDLDQLEKQEGTELNFVTSGIPDGSFLPPRARETLFSIVATHEAGVSEDIAAFVVESLDMVICYCSVYDDQCQKGSFSGEPNSEVECRRGT